MKPRSRIQCAMFGLCIASAAGFIAAAGAAEPKSDARSNGQRSYTQTTQTQRTDNGHTRHTTRTDAKGRTATRDATVVNDRQAGTRDRDVTYTGPNGAVRTVDDHIIRTPDGFERSTVVDRADGDQTSRDVDVSHDAATHTTVKTVTVQRTPAP